MTDINCTVTALSSIEMYEELTKVRSVPSASWGGNGDCGRAAGPRELISCMETGRPPDEPGPGRLAGTLGADSRLCHTRSILEFDRACKVKD